MIKKIISISMIIFTLLFSLCSCNLYLHLNGTQDPRHHIQVGKSLDELKELFGEPDLINKLPPEYFDSQGENEVITSVCYKMDKRKLIGFEPTEYCYFGFDPETGLVNVIIRPWYHPDDL